MIKESATNTVIIRNYAEILQIYGIPYTPSGYYWQVGSIARTQGWILHLSVIKSQSPDLVQIMVPFLINKGVSFKIARDFDTVVSLLDGALGFINVGKIISIYPENDTDAESLALALIEMTRDFKGPDIPTDSHLESILYTRYGSFSPILRNDENGEPVKYIYDAAGKLIQDVYDVPFKYPSNIEWPFGKICSPTVQKNSKLLNYRYYPLATLKPDVKGDVIKAIYFQKWNCIRSCLIKQGKKWMIADIDGRDIRDRLQWQYELYQALKGIIPMPEVFDYFTEGPDSYLAMAFIKGISVNNWIANIYRGRSWRDISTRSKTVLLGKLLEIINIVSLLHQNGFIHRDINSNNFLIDGKGKIWLIDMELAWSIQRCFPGPAFSLGTPGFMSPEQLAQEDPTIQQDIYAVGALAQEFFTGLYPLKLDQNSIQSLEEAIQFLTGDPIVAKYVSSCQSSDVANRPTLREVYEQVDQFHVRLLSSAGDEASRKSPGFPRDKVGSIITAGLRGLISSELVHPKWGWVSSKQKEENYVGNPQMELGLYPGWHTGMAGPLWTVARLKHAGVDIVSCLVTYENSWQYMEEHFFVQPNIYSSGLFSGGAGICMALGEGYRSGLLKSDSRMEVRFESCLSRGFSQMNISHGWAGRGIALLSTEKWIDGYLFEKLFTECLRNILLDQQADGSWVMLRRLGRKGDIVTGLDKGVAGVILFLLACLQRKEDLAIKASVRRALSWLARIGRKKGHTITWTTSVQSKSVDVWDAGIGMPGIALVFIKAFEIFGDAFYREMAENILLLLPERPINMDFSLGSGLAGLGEIYLEAVRAFKDDVWQERASWIGEFLICSCKKNEDGSGYWIPTIKNHITADLFTGNAGILHFLVRLSGAENMSHPLSPFK